MLLSPRPTSIYISDQVQRYVCSSYLQTQCEPLKAAFDDGQVQFGRLGLGLLVQLSDQDVLDVARILLHLGREGQTDTAECLVDGLLGKREVEPPPFLGNQRKEKTTKGKKARTWPYLKP